MNSSNYTEIDQKSKEKLNCGSLVISLDYELMWGVRDKKTIDTYGDAIVGVKSATLQTLNVFNKFNVNATFATVGFLFNKNKNELLNSLPANTASYIDENLSPYPGIDDYIGENEDDDPYYYGYSLLKSINKSGKHEVATHTYCHYYCLEPGQTIEMFDSDLQKAIEVGKREEIKIKSIIFPRNQYSKEYIEICKNKGITCFRGNEKHFIYKSSKGQKQTLFKRGLRLVDGYINITGHHCYSYESIVKTFPYNIPSSRFLRPYNKKLRVLEQFKYRRIINSMTHAAKNNLVYHLWWHPHNFGRNTEENILLLEKILKHFEFLKNKYQFQSITMGDLSVKLNIK